DFTMITSNFESICLQEASHPLLTDINNDDLPDLLVGNFDGGIHFFQNETVTATLPHNLNEVSTLELDNFPNPIMLDTVSGSMTVFSFLLNYQMLTNLSVYNIKGEKVSTLINTILPAGTHQINWDGITDSGKKISTGVYLYSLQAGMFRESGKLIILKR
ncbi:MAG: hypothetical protein JW996_06550, partial [Candidatus Cloacimonetes bacterium]|nr:hypothetical protein [Candidatus Cloacimonadota bacterium]